MKIQSKSNRNLGFCAQHGRIVIVAGSTLELDDDVWKLYEEAASGAIESGMLVVVEDVALSEEELAEQKAEQLVAAQAMLDQAAAEQESLAAIEVAEELAAAEED